jgi:hypothetical protein
MSKLQVTDAWHPWERRGDREPAAKKIVAIAHGDPTPHDLLIPILSSQSATFGEKRNGSEWCSAVEVSQIPFSITRVCARQMSFLF